MLGHHHRSLCKDYIKTNEHVYLQCENTPRITLKLWKEAEDWIRTIQECHFKRADQENVFRCSECFIQITQMINIGVKDGIYQQRKTDAKKAK